MPAPAQAHTPQTSERGHHQGSGKGQSLEPDSFRFQCNLDLTNPILPLSASIHSHVECNENTLLYKFILNLYSTTLYMSRISGKFGENAFCFFAMYFFLFKKSNTVSLAN